jgi:hypothetical protein
LWSLATLDGELRVAYRALQTDPVIFAVQSQGSTSVGSLPKNAAEPWIEMSPVIPAN